MKKLWRAIRDYFVGVAEELKRVTWPTYAQVVRYTIIVTITTVIATVLLTAFDYGMEEVVSRYLIR